ncbi:disintegrin and metalloproteinase domain-containing protein 1a-like [Sorex fumeus]|uniref:disintegrin and metalloproteinase domain-containing protein 1a-like n=1 Tax=Sorex fumeus TaxID=62283 RepID=UPI0024AE4439|nr:disintegrin and metalloproteinase domain-containing protein 1a-like [Sorex fumeus]
MPPVLQAWTYQMKGLRLEQTSLGPSCVGNVLAWVMLIFLPSLSCDPGSVSNSYYEKVIPRNLTVNDSEDSGEMASYELVMHGQRQRIHLEIKRDYFVNDFPVFSYHGGILRHEQPFTPHDCHYEGHLEGVLDSFVSVSTCAGLRGILIKDEQYYSIEPTDPSEGLEHVLYPTVRQSHISCSSIVHTNHSRGEPDGLQQDSRKPSRVQAQSSLWSRTKYVEIFVVVNHQLFQMWDSNISETVQKVMNIIALANSYTRGINTEVVLAGVEIWTEGDLIEVQADLQETLRNFNSWRREQLSHRAPHDVAHLIVGHGAAEDSGQAFLSGACSSEFAAAVESFHHEDVLLFVELLVHELGHNLGMWHDHAACVCKSTHSCLMHKNISQETGFSNCSSDDYYRFLQAHGESCLFNKPPTPSRQRRQAMLTCGNGKREGNEQCDCGDQCMDSRCCTSDCKLKGQAECGGGDCCSDDCKFQPRGYVCRSDAEDCDLPEYCDGISPECPQDLYKVDGSTCDEMYVCSGGKCKSHRTKCMDLFGDSATSAPESCYMKVNSQGNRFGNCGRATSADTSYTRCSKDNIYCGKIVCVNVDVLPNIEEYYTVSSFWHDGSYCWTMDAYHNNDIPDRGDIDDETGCFSEKACQENTCTNFLPRLSCKVEQCNLHGICNNLNKCYCFPGFAPPTCAERGAGGSEDGGSPVEPETSDPKKERGSAIEKEKGLSVAVLSALIFLLLLTLIIIISAIIFSKTQEPPSRETDEYTETEESEEEEELEEEEAEAPSPTEED